MNEEHGTASFGVRGEAPLYHRWGRVIKKA
jgi:hypothetical protein